MAVDYPLDFRTILVGRQKSQTPLIRTHGPLSGPSYIEKLSDDAPLAYNVTFTFGSNNEEALIFLAWIKVNNIQAGAPFNLPILTEGSGFVDSQETQEVFAIPDVDITSNIHNGLGVFTYQAVLRCRKEVTGMEAYYPIIEEGGSYLLRGRESLDKSINLYAPEV